MSIALNIKTKASVSLRHVIQPHLLQSLPCTSAILTSVGFLSCLRAFALCLRPGIFFPKYPYSSHSPYFVFYCYVTSYPKFTGINIIISVGQEFGHGLGGSSTQGLTRLQPRCQWATALSEAQLGKICFPAPSSCCRIQLFVAIRLRPILLLTVS